ncbi:hypothetical protein P9112_003108 [Eukaryota sp. TZLM1-RC]
MKDTDLKILYNGTVVTHGPNCQVIENGAVAFQNSTIVDVGTSSEVLYKHLNNPDVVKIDVEGRLIAPGLISAHTHFYGMYSRGMALKDDPPANFGQVLERLWWRLDKALDNSSTKLSAQVCLAEAIRCGMTTVFDHHASPSALEGSLDVIADVCKEAGVRACLTYEISNRNGADEALAGLTENVRFIENLKALPEAERAMLAGMIGLHAQFTVSDEILTKCAEAMKNLDVGCHIHVAEGIEDVAETYGPVERLHKFGLTSSKSLFAHCVHVNDKEVQILKETGTVVSHQPESNMNNGVGVADIPKLLENDVTVVLGTDGMHNDMLREMRAAYFVNKLAKKDPRVMGPQPAEILFQNNAQLASNTFGVNVGELEKGAVADLIILDYFSPTPISAGNFPWHVVFGMGSQLVHSTICNGKFLMYDRELLTLNAEVIAAEAKRIAPEVWERF